nr:estrogen sulfotransferase-like [Onthophagus taurus]
MSSDKLYSSINLKNVENCYMPPDFFLIKEKIEHFQVRNDDIWVTSYPKAGTTWTQEMVWLIANDLNYEGAKIDLDLRFPMIEINCLPKVLIEFGKKHDLFSIERLNMLRLPDIIKILDESNGQRFIKTHLPWYLLPRQIIEGLKTPKIIHVMRDPKQVATSYYHHCSNIFPVYKGDLNTFIDLYIQGKVLIGDYFNVVLSYWKRRNLPNILFLTYEEMYSDLKGVVNKVSNFLGKSYSENEIDELVQHLSFDQMKINKAVNKESVVQTEDARFMRIGKTDSYKTELNEEMIDKLNKWVLENMKGTNLPYETS